MKDAPLIVISLMDLLHHHLTAILDDDALEALVHLLTCHIVANSLSVVSLNGADSGRLTSRISRSIVSNCCSRSKIETTEAKLIVRTKNHVGLTSLSIKYEPTVFGLIKLINMGKFTILVTLVKICITDAIILINQNRSLPHGRTIQIITTINIAFYLKLRKRKRSDGTLFHNVHITVSTIRSIETDFEHTVNIGCELKILTTNRYRCGNARHEIETIIVGSVLSSKFTICKNSLTYKACHRIALTPYTTELESMDLITIGIIVPNILVLVCL